MRILYPDMSQKNTLRIRSDGDSSHHTRDGYPGPFGRMIGAAFILDIEDRSHPIRETGVRCFRGLVDWNIPLFRVLLDQILWW